MTDSRWFTTVQGFGCKMDKRFKESAGLEKVIKRQLAGLRYE